MNIRITVDNNFFDSYETCPHEYVKESIKNTFIKKRLSFYPSLELILELLGMWGNKKRRISLVSYAQFLSEVIDYRVLNDQIEIIKGELGVKQDKIIFLNKDYVDQIKKVLEDLSLGREPSSIDIKEAINKAKNEKKRMYEVYRVSKEQFLKGKKEAGLRKQISFKHFYCLDSTIDMRKNLVRHIYHSAGKAIANTEIDNILANPKRYEYFTVLARTIIGMLYLHFIEERRVDLGDNYDRHYLVYSTGLDYLVSNDKKMKRLGEVVFAGVKKVIDFDEFSGLVNQ